MEGVGLRVKNEGLFVFGFCTFYMKGCYGLGINCLTRYFYEHIFFFLHKISSDLVLCFDLLNCNCEIPTLRNLGYCSCRWYFSKVKSTPSFGLGWEFDKNNEMLIMVPFLFLLSIEGEILNKERKWSNFLIIQNWLQQDFL